MELCDAFACDLRFAVKRYFDLMFTSEMSCFDHVFAPSAHKRKGGKKG